MNYSNLFDLARDLYGYLSYTKSGKAVMPLRYVLELTYKCNLQCPYCYVGDSRTKDEMNKEEWFKIIEQIPFFGFITLLGGEPLINKNFIEIFEKSSKQVMGKVNVISNGVLLTDEVINSFIKNNLLLLSVSLDGYGETHNRNRCKADIFDKIITNLDNLQSRKAKKLPMIDVKTIVLENNLDDIPKLYRLSSDMGFKFFSVGFKRNNHLKQNSCLRETFGEEFYAVEYPLEPYFDMEHFKEVYKELESIAKTSKTTLRWAPKFKSTGVIDSIEQYFNFTNKDVNEIYKPCLHPFSNLYITPEGNLYPCLSYKTGNVRNSKIKDVINAPDFRCFRKNLRASKLFNSCQLCCEAVPKNQ